MSKVILQGYIVVHDDDLSAVLAELPQHIKLTLQEEGCLVFRVNQDPDNINRFNIYEEFTNRVEFEAHQERVANSRWGQIAINIERHYQISGDS